MSQTGSSKKVANRLVALSSAAVLAVYAAGYVRTKPAAARFEIQAAERRPAPQLAPQGAPTNVSAPAPTVDLEPPTVASIHSAAPESLPVPAAAPSAESAPVPVETQVPAEPPAAPPVTAPAIIPVPEQKESAIAAPPLPAPPPPAPPAPPVRNVWKDGTYLGWGSSRHGDIQAQVTIAGGRIESAIIARCLTRYSCDVIEHLPPQVAQRQSADVDTVSRATQSADAFYYAVTDALSKAK